MKIAVTTFAGMAPRIAARLLPEQAAQLARNARLHTGDLQAFAGTQYAADTGRGGVIQTLYRFADTYWFTFNEDVDVVRGPVPDDTSERTYYTGAGVPRVTNNVLAIQSGTSAYPAASRQLGIPAPESGLVAEVAGTITDDNPALIETRFYTWTYISDLGEQGPSAPVSNAVDVGPGQSVTLTGIAPAPAGEYVIDTARIYRTASSGATTAFEYVTEVPVGQTSVTDTLDADALGEQLPSADWIAPPEDMHSLVALPNGILAGASGLDVCLSEPYRPHAWPLAYRQTVDDPIVGLGVVANSLVVLTSRYAYLITGSSPASMAMTRIGSDELACVAKRSIDTLPGVGVVFASPDGITAISTAGAQNLTRDILTRRDWQAYTPAAMHGVVHEHRYMLFYPDGCLVFDAQAGALYELDLAAEAAYRDPVTDTLYLARDGAIDAWDRAESVHAPYIWRSKRFELPNPAVFTLGKLRAADYGDITLRVYADGALVATIAAANRQMFRLPITRRANAWELELTGTSRVYDVQIAETVEEID